MKNFIITVLLCFSTFTMAEQMQIPLIKLIGQFNEKSDSNFVALDSTILPVNKKGMYLQQEATNQLIKAYQDFKKIHPDIPFVVVSATRNYNYQSGIWQRKWDTLLPKLKDPQKIAVEILKYSSMPGTSRHHWGTDVDITNLSSSYFTDDPKGKVLHAWLQENMPKYGFCQAFNPGRRGGYQTEEWHWSYKPIAQQYIAQYKEILETDPKAILAKLDFIGHDKITLQQLVSQYVLTVNSDCY